MKPDPIWILTDDAKMSVYEPEDGEVIVQKTFSVNECAGMIEKLIKTIIRSRQSNLEDGYWVPNHGYHQ